MGLTTSDAKDLVVAAELLKTAQRDVDGFLNAGVVMVSVGDRALFSHGTEAGSTLWKAALGELEKNRNAALSRVKLTYAIVIENMGAEDKE